MSGMPGLRVSSSEKLAAIIESLEITPFQKDLLRQRWLDQVKWMGDQARKARRRYLWIRVPVVVGSVAIPGLVTILLSGATTVSWLGGLSIDYVRLAAFAISLSVGVLAGLEEVLHYGERWRHYRRTAEILKTLGWQYLMLNGAFRRHASHATAYAAFTERVEDVLNEDVEGYLGAMSGDGADRSRPEIIA
jgi:hypothetical protein